MNNLISYQLHINEFYLADKLYTIIILVYMISKRFKYLIWFFFIFLRHNRSRKYCLIRCPLRNECTGPYFIYIINILVSDLNVDGLVVRMPMTLDYFWLTNLGKGFIINQFEIFINKTFSNLHSITIHRCDRWK